ncbi:MAG: hypothetical protein FH747_06780 [Stenotrophomonas sp.]|uniref:hypothetical protein n=1 Tax=Stenotrophomonas sp. TaxID=69392 RepID=UPI001354E367|nr:hypothetical protein [Stenotrophomonas sp.]MTI73352.1 hypothetical protein [Stenotrophomonas sp.]
MNAAVADNDVTVLAPASMVVPYQGGEITVAPLRVGIIPQVIRELRPILARLRPAAGAQGGFDLDIGMDLLLDLLEHSAANLFAAAALCTGRTREEIEAGNAAELLALVMAIVGVNRDFFTQRIAPLLGGLQPSTAGAGATPSSS